MNHEPPWNWKGLAGPKDPWFRMWFDLSFKHRWLYRRGLTKPLLEIGFLNPKEPRSEGGSSLRGVGFDEILEISDDAETALVWSRDGIVLFQKPSDQPRHLAPGGLVPALSNTIWLPAAN